MYALLAFVALMRTADSLVCFECSASSDKDCYEQQKLILCKGYNDRCYTMIHKKHDVQHVKDDKVVTNYGFQKGCADSRKKCVTKCDWYRSLGYQCQTECCYNSECNKHGIASQRSKRRVPNSSFTTSYDKRVLVIILTTFIFFSFL